MKYVNVLSWDIDHPIVDEESYLRVSIVLFHKVNLVAKEIGVIIQQVGIADSFTECVSVLKM
jgi:hypothetical protein